MRRNWILRTGVAAAAIVFALQAQAPTCNKCSATYISSDEIQAYLKRAEENGLVDQQTRAVDIGKANIGIGVVYRANWPGHNLMLWRSTIW